MVLGSFRVANSIFDWFWLLWGDFDSLWMVLFYSGWLHFNLQQELIHVQKKTLFDKKSLQLIFPY